YYYSERATVGLTGVQGYCIVQADCPDGTMVPPLPVGPEKKTVDFSTHATYRAIGFSVSDPIYYAYGVGSYACLGGGNNCQLPALPFTAFTLSAAGDLDGDGRFSAHQIYVGVNERSEMFRAGGFYEYPIIDAGFFQLETE
ncbi:MAG: hypothetical protein KC416_04630, partial [Myxococcales bacterium]|nr:hypothetical protein [Myxococcales bacterium]